MGEIEHFIAACRAALATPNAPEAVHAALVERLAMGSVLAEPEEAGFRTLHHAPDLTILDFTLGPLQCFKPHNHKMWAVIGLLDGREDNLFWRRHGDSIDAFGGCSIGAGDAVILPADIIHSVTNPLEKRSRALHIYGGDFFAPGRSEWDHETLVEQPWRLDEGAKRKNRDLVTWLDGQQ